jgi:soluble lytic murein transglycosylase-like protein
MNRIAIGCGILMMLAAFLAAAPAARADWVVLRNGQRLHVTGCERRGNELILHLAGGQATLRASDVLRIEPEDVFPAALPVPAAAPFRKMIADAAKKNGLDRRLLRSVVHAESNFQPRAVSPRGALGLMQLMPKTARNLAVRNPFDPSQNVDGGARYLKQLLGQFGSLNLALAAYNAGPARVTLYHGIPPFPETRAYIARVRRGMKQPAVRTKKRNAAAGVKVVCSPLETRCREEATSNPGNPASPLR